MRHPLLATLLVVASIASTTAVAADLKTDEDKAFYALGAAVARQVAGFDLSAAELEKVKAGFSDVALHKKTQLEPSDYFPKLQELQTTRLAAAAAVEKKAGEEYLAKAAAAPGATKTASGLIYTVIKEGTGATPKATDNVKVHYHGTLPNGKVFDSSVERKEPATFPLNGVIPCWTEGVQLMKVGGKSHFVCPSDIAYGDRGSPPDIRPGSTLIFDVELLAIENPPQQ
ncbi:MAG TPA: FKBP-type peptidyl-prolyl cis-trans isomerase [Steroidobacteraceae bacterium]|jgi:FKBP-type peptidyl-prolyl cis-trans isomerase FkpA/FKBP-type peptidyl-prolyl cis-trans isomerase FklB